MSTSGVQPDGESDRSTASIRELGLRTRAENVLLDGGISTVGDALAALEEGDDALLSLKGFGPKSLADLKTGLQKGGFTLSGEPVPSSAAAPAVEEGGLEEEPEELGELASATAAVPTAAVPFFGQRLRATLAQGGERIGLGPLVYSVVGLLVIAALLLPPISLLDRLGIVGYTTLNAKNNTVSHPDGVSVSVDPATSPDRVRVRLESVPRLEFLEGSAGSALRKAVEALPDHLVVKSPYYKIRMRGDSSAPVTIDVLVPNEAEPWETLDLYTWTGEEWQWVGSDLHTEVAEHEFIRARVSEEPDSVVVVQSQLMTSTVAAYAGSDDDRAAVESLDGVNPTGLLLGTMGGFAGNLDALLYPPEGVDCGVLPALRNWAPGGSVNRGLLADLLADSGMQDAHIANIVQLCEEQGFDGVEIGYRGVSPEERDAYSSFIGALADALHAEGLQLSVAVDRPTPTDGGWDTGGYDWAALGAAADAVKVPFPEDPAAYVEGGEAQRLLEWAKAQVPRHKLRMVVSSLSAVQSGDEVAHVSLEQALAPFGEITALAEVDRIEPNTAVSFGLSGPLLSIRRLDGAGTYRLEYTEDDGATAAVWLGTAANLAAKLSWAKRYHLGGVAVADALDPGNMEGVLNVVTNYPNIPTSPATEEMDIVWTVASGSATLDQQTSPLTDPSYTWTAPDEPGTYTVTASVVGFDHGSVTIRVAEPEPTASEPVTETEAMASERQTAEAEEAEVGASAVGAAGAGGGALDECLNATYVADVTIPDNTQLDNGEPFEKTWRVRNNGTCGWPQDAMLAFVSGTQMGAPDSVEVDPVEPGQKTEVTVPMEAPGDAGRYQGVWRMRTADGFFGGNLTVVIQAGEVAEAASAAPAPPGRGSFELGGHISDWGFPYADKMHYAGMNWAKVQVRYPGDASGIVGASHANGFKIQISALGSADMVTQPGFEQDFANWVAGLAAAGADAIEVWNEPNIEREWQAGHISPQAYKNLLCTAYNAIKNANSGTAVIAAAPAPTGYFGGCSANGCDDLPWLQGLYNAGASQCMDYIGAHHNSGATSPSARSGHPADSGNHHHSWYFLPQTELYYNIFGGARQLFYTEMGYVSPEGYGAIPAGFGDWGSGTTVAQQAAWLAEAARLSINTGMVRCIIVWNVDYRCYGICGGVPDPQAGYAILRPDGSCPACDALHGVLGTR